MKVPRPDASAVSLLVANAITIGIALVQGWSLAVLMWVYWGQSIIIGFFSFFKILSLRQFSADGFRINDRTVSRSPTTWRGTPGGGPTSAR